MSSTSSRGSRLGLVVAPLVVATMTLHGVVAAEEAPTPTVDEAETLTAAAATAAEEAPAVDELRCAVARCTSTPEGVRCSCHDAPVPPEASAAPTAPRAPAVDVPASAVPAALEVPVASAGFPVLTHRFGLLAEVGFPHMDLGIVVRAHDAVTLGVGLQTFYGFSNAGYGSVKVRFLHNDEETRSLALRARAGYGRHASHVDSLTVEILGYDGLFTEFSLLGSFRRGRHALDLMGGAQVGWVREQLCYDYWYCGWYRDGRAGVAFTLFAEVGWSVRIRPRVSFYLSAGASFYVNSETVPVLPRGGTGFIINL